MEQNSNNFENDVSIYSEHGYLVPMPQMYPSIYPSYQSNYHYMVNSDQFNGKVERSIIDVWDGNFEEEIEKIRGILPVTSFIVIDTEFPGTVVRPVYGPSYFDLTNPENYYGVALSVNSSVLIQLGISFYNEFGLPLTPEGSTWQFNFKYNNDTELHFDTSITLLKENKLDLDRFSVDGVDYNVFVQRFYELNILFNPTISWITFHGGCDMAYLLKLLSGSFIPYEIEDFMTMLEIYFPISYDLKFIFHMDDRKGGLSKLAQEFNVKRFGIQHQAGSDALLTGDLFFVNKQKAHRNVLDSFKYCGFLTPFANKGYKNIKENGYPNFFYLKEFNIS